MTTSAPTYDRFGHDGLKMGAGGGQGGFSAEGFGDIFGDVFGDIFGGGRRGGGQQVFRGADLGYELQLDLETAVAGDSVNDRCPDPGQPATPAVAVAPRRAPSPCPARPAVVSGRCACSRASFRSSRRVPACKGVGTTIADPCEDCHGRGRVRKTRTLSVKVPAGVDDGDRIRLSGEGEAGRNGGPPGDLYVEIRVKPHKIFEREGANLSCEVPVSFGTATLGGEVELPTLDGTVSLKIPAGTQSGKTFRLRGKGVSTVRDPRHGDLFAQVSVETPVNLTSEQKELLEKFEASISSGGDKHSPRADSWLDTVKRFFERLSP